MSSFLVMAEQEGIYFYTDTATGESGLSQAGLAELCGVSRQAVSKLLKVASTGKAPKWLESLSGKNLSTSTISPRGGDVEVLNAEVCVAVIKHYAFSGHSQAQYTLDKFVAIGFNAWVQDMTGWRSSKSAVQSNSLPSRSLSSPVPLSSPPPPPQLPGQSREEWLREWGQEYDRHSEEYLEQVRAAETPSAAEARKEREREELARIEQQALDARQLEFLAKQIHGNNWRSAFNKLRR